MSSLLSAFSTPSQTSSNRTALAAVNGFGGGLPNQNVLDGLARLVIANVR